MSFLSRRNVMRPRFATLGGMLRSTALRYRLPNANGSQHMLSALSETVEPLLDQPAESTPEVLKTEDPLAQVEAVLFLTREPLSTRKLAKLANLADGTEARTMLKQLARRYDQRGRALQVVEVAGGFQLMTRPQLAPWIGRLHGEAQEVRLSAPALETLSVVAYRQPVVRAEIEAIRGVQCGEILRVLMERDLLRIVGRSEELGRPFLYGTTKNFLQFFGLKRLEQLPEIDQTHSIAS